MNVTVATVLRVDHNKCCFCLPYRAGVIIIAVLTLFESLGDIVFGSFAVGAVRCHGNLGCIQILVLWFGVTSIVQGLVSLVMSILLLVGVFKNIPNLLTAYMIMMIVNAMCYFGVGVAMLTEVQRYFWNDYAYYGAWFVIWSPLICFFVSVVRVYRFMMIHQSRSPHPQHLMSSGNEPQPYGVENTYFSEDPLSTEQAEYPMNTQLPPGTELPLGYYQDPYLPQSLEIDTAPGTNQHMGSFVPAYEQDGNNMPETNEQPRNDEQSGIFMLPLPIYESVSSMLPASDQQPGTNTPPEINQQPTAYTQSMINQETGSYTPTVNNQPSVINTPPLQNQPPGTNIPHAINQQPGNDKQPVTSHQLETNMPPIANQKLETYTSPVATQQPENYTQSVPNQQLETNMPPIANSSVKPTHHQ